MGSSPAAETRVYVLDAGDLDAPEIPSTIWRSAKAGFVDAWDHVPHLEAERRALGEADDEDQDETAISLSEFLVSH